MLKTVPVLILAATIATTGLAAQQTTEKPTVAPGQAAQTPAPAPQRAPEPPPLPLNVKVEIVITDQSGPGEAAKKTVSMIVGDRQNNSIRSSAQIRIPNSSATRSVGINVDARPVINAKEPNKVLLSFGLDYQPRTGGGGGETPEPNTSSLTQRLALNLESGKTVLVSQSADPASDRKITVEVTATILK